VNIPRRVTAKLAAILALCAAAAGAQSKPPCTYFTVVSQDTLNNVTQGLSTEDMKWFEKEIAKKYPSVCYAEPPAAISVVFYITVTKGVYHGARLVNQSSTQPIPIGGTVTAENGSSTSEIDGTTESTTTNSAVLPYTRDYGIFTLAVERRSSDGTLSVAHRFQQDGLYKTIDGIPLRGRAYQPNRAVIEDAVKWLDAGGLSDPNQSVLPLAATPAK
jgi:hypothetical protein